MFFRTTSTPDRSNDDYKAREIFISKKTQELERMVADHKITEAQGAFLLGNINEYIKMNGGKTKRGFEEDLKELIANKLVEFLGSEIERLGMG